MNNPIKHRHRDDLFMIAGGWLLDSQHAGKRLTKLLAKLARKP